MLETLNYSVYVELGIDLLIYHFNVIGILLIIPCDSVLIHCRVLSTPGLRPYCWRGALKEFERTSYEATSCSSTHYQLMTI